MQPKRILHVIGSMGCGGAETLIMNLFRNVDKTKVVFDFLVHTDKEAYYDQEIYSLGGRIYHIKKFNGFNPISYYRTACGFFRDHKEYSVVHGHIGSSCYLYLLAAKKCGCYTIAHSHSTGNGIRNLHDFAYNIYSFPTRYVADAFFGCSTEAGIKRYGKKVVNGDRYYPFYNGIDTDRFLFDQSKRMEIRNELGIKNEFTVGTLGRLTEAKNPMFSIDVFYQLLQIIPDAKFIWVGDGELRNEIENKIKQYGISSSIYMVGQQKSVERYLMAMDVFLFPSKWEGLPTSVIEAQASGLPCLLSDTITKDVHITELIYWKSLNESPSLWAEELLDMKCGNRSDYLVKIKSSGYDIREESQLITEFYERNGVNAK